ncbi:MAG: hypothetical protein ACHQRK_07165 [Gemmatimonadales bacterium]
MQARTLRRGVIALAIAVPILPPALLGAQGAKTPDADDAALRSYTLTMGNMQKLRQTMLNLKAYMMAHANDPDVADSMGDSDEDQSQMTLAQQIRHIDAMPPLKQAILKAGFTPRDYVMTTMTYMQAAMQAGVAQYVKDKPVPIPANMNPANAQFLKTHQAEIAKLELDKLMGGAASEP